MAGSTIVIHAADWLEGGSTLSYEKLVTDMEILQTVAEMCHQATLDGPNVSLGALAEISPGGHFFAAEHTMSRYQTEFYEPLVSDCSNFGSWTESGGRTTSERATDIWKSILAGETDLGHDPARVEAMRSFTAERRTATGGALPES